MSLTHGSETPSCAKAEVTAANLLSAEQYSNALELARNHMQDNAPHGEICRYNLACAYWGVGDPTGDEVWAMNHQPELELGVFDNHTPLRITIGRHEDEVTGEQLYHQIRLETIKPDTVAEFFDHALFTDKQRQIYPRVITAWLRLIELDIPRSQEATEIYDWHRHDLRDAIPFTPVLWQRRLATVDMISFALQGSIKAGEIAQQNLNHPVPHTRKAARALNRLWGLAPGMLLEQKANRTRKIGANLFQRALPHNDIAVKISPSYYLAK